MPQDWSQADEKRYVATMVCVIGALRGSVVVAPSDWVSDDAALEAAYCTEHDSMDIGTTAREIEQWLAWQQRVGADNYTLVVRNAAKMTSQGWESIRTAMPMAGLIVMATDPQDVPLDIRATSKIVDGLAGCVV